ncbi:EVE domain-containing protein [Bacillus sp. OV166]|uniref:AAA family ATPase n=1 Tax=Bacillus sp. OV166 TaxID=1882763 RepID=UPI000A2AC6CE|nr:AAA family ATPase [Bacillus sp. OV166]SMQ78500.1 EVE domain-containing protein [Bacillus sp. OV166]
MGKTISNQEAETLRKEFRTYLAENHPDWSDNTIAVHYSDAFFAYNNNVGIDFWSSFLDEASLNIAEDKIRDYLKSHNQSHRAKERASGYLHSMKHFKAFLDERHPNLAIDWSGKTASNTYLKTAFQNWMRRQKKSNGEPYKSNTITAYTNSLKNATAKLNIDDLPETDLFHITSVAGFEEVYKTITSAPNFHEVDLAAGNKAYSNGLVLYSRFLKELEEPSCWVFQGNPKFYDVIGAVHDLDTITWAVNQNPKQIKKGDKVYIWLSGPQGGIVASGTILCDPEIKQPERNDPYNRSEDLNKEPYLGVDIDIQRKLIDSIVERTTLLADERTKRMEILTYPGATNFRVSKKEYEVIESIITGSYKKVPSSPTPTPAVQKEKKRYWIYAPGEGSSKWEEFYDKGIMGIGWDKLGDLKQYPTKDSMKTKMKEIYGEEYSYMNAGHLTWQFANELKIDDVIIVKKGLKKIIGRGIVTSDYIFDDSRNEFKHIRNVRWTHRGEWDHEGQIVLKTLTDITPYTDYYKKLEDMFISETDTEVPEDDPVHYESYTAENFLSEVYMNEDKYHTLKKILLKKKNLILLGAPGVGKTFAAERLAYSIMGEKDTSRVMMIQFHQSYSYEDFIMGYRPTEKGFSLSKGPFYKFCKDAEPDERPYFFIIDEINRGNLSKIFGELLMLIEHDKRGKDVRLLYSDEQFSVPENVHIIGMMNTADRSLAMIDYALRRRFAFYEFDPAFSSDGFKEYQGNIASEKFDRLIDTVVKLNLDILEDASLGSGFQIGHSYFSTNEYVDDGWISDVIEYELIPLIKEYWFDEPSKIEHWSSKLRVAIHD